RSQLPIRQLVRAHRIHPGRSRGGVVRDRVALGAIRWALSPERLGLPKELLQQRPAQVQLPGWRSLSADDVRRSGIRSESAAADVLAVRAGSLDRQPVLLVGRASLRAPLFSLSTPDDVSES